MDQILAFGRFLLPIAIDLLLKISLVSFAALAAGAILGPRRPGLGFGVIIAALILGASAGLLKPVLPPPNLDNLSPFTFTIPDPPLPKAPAVSVLSPATIPMHELAGEGAPRPKPVSRNQAANTAPVQPTDWLGAIGVVWGIGTFVALGWRAGGRMLVRRRMSAYPTCDDQRILAFADRAWLKLSRGTRFPAAMPLLLSSPRYGPTYSAGIRRGRIVLPVDASTWSDERLGATMLHEMKHVLRRDNLLSELLFTASALAWWSPLPWSAMEKAILFREQSCDEAALDAGVEPFSYATNLLNAARSLQTAPAASSGMAGQGRLEKRIFSILEWSTRKALPFAIHHRAALSLILVAAVSAVAFCGAAAGEDPRRSLDGFSPSGDLTWPVLSIADGNGDAVRPPTGLPGSFTLYLVDETARIKLRDGGRLVEADLPINRLPLDLPLGARARYGRPNGRGMGPLPAGVFSARGWELWDDRPARVTAAGPGVVVVSEALPGSGAVIEIDHGSGLRTRYAIRRYGAPLVGVGQRVSAGQRIATLGVGQSDDIPYIEFAVIYELGKGRRYSLDPAPFVFGTAAGRALRLGTSVMNQAVRVGDGSELSRLIATGVDPNRTAVDGSLPLEWAVIGQDVGAAAALVAAGADPLARIGTQAAVGNPRSSTMGTTLRDFARDCGNADMIAALSPTGD